MENKEKSNKEEDIDKKFLDILQSLQATIFGSDMRLRIQYGGRRRDDEDYLEEKRHMDRCIIDKEITLLYFIRDNFAVLSLSPSDRVRDRANFVIKCLNKFIDTNKLGDLPLQTQLELAITLYERIRDNPEVKKKRPKRKKRDKEEE
jgi:hypothetical protein